MSRFYLSTALLLACCMAALGQSPTPTPTPDGDVVRISTNLIQLDVTVTDGKGQPITDLRPDEVEIYENGRKKRLTNFSFVPGTRPTGVSAERNKTLAQQRPMLPAGPVRPESVRRTVAIVVDDLNLSFASALWVKEALKKFLREQLQDGDLVAIIRTGGGTGVSQQFTTDRRLLLAAAERTRYNHRGTFGASYFDPERAVGGVVNEKEAEINQLRQDIFGSGTIGVLNFVVRGMRELPGRKSVVLLTDNVNIYERDSRGRVQFSLNHYRLRRLIDFANRSSVSFYPIQAAGLLAPGITAEDDITDLSFVGGERTTDGILSGRLNSVKDAQDGMKFLAENTGGFAVINTNNIGRGIRRIMDDQSYYLVAYDPDDNTFDPRSRGTFDPKTLSYIKFEVKVSRPGARVRYRSGFLGVSDEENTEPAASVTNQIITAITSPFTMNQIDVRMNAIFAADAERKPSVISFINVDPATLTFTDVAGGLRRTSFDLVAFTFGAEGNVIDERSKNFTITVTRAQYDVLAKRGLVGSFSLPVKNSGGHQVRLAVRDLASGRLGTASQFVEVPKVSDGKFALSGAILSSGSASGPAATDAVSLDSEDPLRHTSVKQFKPGTPLEFWCFAYNPKLGPDKRARLLQSYRLYKDQEIVFTSSERQVAMQGQPSPRVIAISGGIMLGAELLPGDYVLEVIIRDQLNKKRTATQFIQFEIVG